MESDPSAKKKEGLLIEDRTLPLANRLVNVTDFDRVFQRARRSSDRYFTVLYSRNNLGYPRLGHAIARKRIRHAVARNRLKRIIRESFRQAKNQLSGVDIVIMARDQAGSAANRVLFASLEEHWREVTRANRT